MTAFIITFVVLSLIRCACRLVLVGGKYPRINVVPNFYIDLIVAVINAGFAIWGLWVIL